MKAIGFAVAVAAFTLTGCVVPQQEVPRLPFPEAEYSALQKTGTGEVSGQVFMRTVGGDVKYGAGSVVYLQPVTSYTTQWYVDNFQGGKNLAPPDPRAALYSIKGQADGNGNFSFTGVPPGKYYLSSEVRWSAPSQYGLLPQGGVIAKEVSVQNGQKLREMLTN